MPVHVCVYVCVRVRVRLDFRLACIMIIISQRIMPKLCSSFQTVEHTQTSTWGQTSCCVLCVCLQGCIVTRPVEDHHVIEVSGLLKHDCVLWKDWKDWKDHHVIEVSGLLIRPCSLEGLKINPHHYDLQLLVSGYHMQRLLLLHFC